ncbi:MAG: T9SS type A sorting domain-containing protein [Paludibacter sp.]
MKKIIAGLFLLLLAIPFYCQTQQQINLDKYWRYRNRLREKFIKVSENVMDQGTNIPAAEIFYNDPENLTYMNNRICWGDENSNMSQYLSVLATELWILKNNGQDYTVTLKELYYAMLALERLDYFSESYFRGGTINDGDINGFSLRDDVSLDFWSKYKSHFDAKISQCDGFLVQNSNLNGHCSYKEANSQDIIEHRMLGLGLISKLLTSSESIANLPCVINATIVSYLTNKGIMNTTQQTVDFSLWAKDIVKRNINSMQYSDLTSIVGVLGLFDAALSHWVLFNPVTNTPVLEGNGKDGGVAMISHGIVFAGQAITGENLAIYPSFGDVNSFSMLNSVFTDDNFRNTMFPNSDPIYTKFDLIRTVACIGNVSTNNATAFDELRQQRDQWYYYGNCSFYNRNNTKSTYISEHLPLVNLVMHDPDYRILGVEDTKYNSEIAIYQGLLDTAPYDGPATNCPVTNWTSISRCLWPEHLGKTINQQPDQAEEDKVKTTSRAYVDFNGLDYMMLHNLYYIAFRKEDIRSLNITTADVDRRTYSQYAKTIESTASVVGSDVTYRAKQQIKLQPGFSASSIGNKKFVAYVGTRPNNYDGSIYVMPPSPQSMSRKKNISNDNTETLLDDIQSTNINISIYPNPSKGKFEISANSSNFPVNYRVANSNGVVVSRDCINSNNQVIDISALPKGFYFISLYLNDKTVTKKIILN